MEEETNISCLPDEILQNIFSFLPIYDRLKAALVCKHWLKVLNCEFLLKDIFVRWERPFFHCVLSQRTDISFDLPLSRRFSSFMFRNVDLSDKHLQFFVEHGQYIQQLDFSFCRASYEIQTALRSRKLCQNLNILTYAYCFFNIFPFLPELKILHLDSYVRSFLNWKETIPKLEEIQFSIIDNPTIHFLSSVFKDFPNILCSAFLTNKNYVSFFNNLTWENGKPNFQLKKLHIHCNYGQQLSTSVISTSLACQYHLTDLSLAGDFDGYHLKLICNLLPSLFRLKLRGTLFNNSSIKYIFQLKLQELILECCVGIPRNAFAQVPFNNFQSLKKLELCHTQLEDEVLKSLLEQFPNLHSLILNGYANLSDEMVKLIFKLVFLKTLVINDCDNVTDGGIYDDNRPERSISNIKGLKKLSLKCKKLTSSGLLNAIKFPELHSVTISAHFIGILEKQLKLQNPSLVYINGINVQNPRILIKTKKT